MTWILFHRNVPPGETLCAEPTFAIKETIQPRFMRMSSECPARVMLVIDGRDQWPEFMVVLEHTDRLRVTLPEVTPETKIHFVVENISTDRLRFAAMLQPEDERPDGS